MSITTKILAQIPVTTLVGTGSVNDPTYFINPDDANSFAQANAQMSASASTTNSAKLVLDFVIAPLNSQHHGAKSKSSAPDSTRTRRRLIYKYRLTNSLFNSSTGSTARARIRYSINSGSSWTTIQDLFNTIVGSTQDSGIITSYVDLSISQDISMVKVELFAETISGLAGSTAVNTVVSGFHAYVEDFEEFHDLIVISPTSTTTDFAGNTVQNDVVNPTYAYDNDNVSFSLQSIISQTGNSGDVFYNRLIFNFPLETIPGGLVHAQLVTLWSNFIFSQYMTWGMIDYYITEICVMVDGSSYINPVLTPYFNNDAGMEGTAFGGTPQNETFHKDPDLFVFPITTIFQDSSKVKVKSEARYSLSGSTFPNEWIDHEIYETRLELRVGSNAGGFTGWEAV